MLRPGVRVIQLDDQHIETIHVHRNGTVISFPVPPKKVILGRKKSFDLEYIENDVAIAPLTNDGTSNLFVYMLGRRFSFRLVVSQQGGDEIILVRDPRDQSFRVEVK
jgi:hypothetical protein